MNIAIVSDACPPQVNGVVRTLSEVTTQLRRMGHQVTLITPAGRWQLPCPTYPEIRLSLRPGTHVRSSLGTRHFDAVHISTEGPLGIAARRYCINHNLPFTTACHTRLNEYLRMRLLLPERLGTQWLRRFHGAAQLTMVRSPAQRRALAAQGFRNLAVWPGAVNHALFRPREKNYWSLPRPIAVYAGRVAPEKNLRDFLELELPGSKVIIGDGPARPRLQRQFPRTRFIGYLHGESLAHAMASADVFVFPSRTDTLGLVMLEAMACGVPVAAYPVQGPVDVIRDGCTGALDTDLRRAVFRAMRCAPEDCVEHAAEFSPRNSAERFLCLLQPVHCESSPPPRSMRTVSAYNAELWPSPVNNYGT